MTTLKKTAKSVTRQRAAICELLREHRYGLTSREIASALYRAEFGESGDWRRRVVQKMHKLHEAGIVIGTRLEDSNALRYTLVTTKDIR